MNRLTTLTLIAALAVSAQLAHAADAYDTPRVDVHFGDLDLSGVQGATVMYSRLQTAAKLVCDRPNSRDPSQASVYKACVAAAMSSAVTRLDRPMLSAYHRSKVQGRNAREPQTASTK